MDKVERTIGLLNEGLNCSQAVLTAFGEPHGIDAALARRLGRPWGGGIGHQALTCGALTGAVLALGLDRDDPDEAQARTDSSDAVCELFRRFEERHGSTLCSALLGADMSTAEGNRKIQEQGLTARICPGLVRSAAEILEGLDRCCGSGTIDEVQETA